MNTSRLANKLSTKTSELRFLVKDIQAISILVDSGNFSARELDTLASTGIEYCKRVESLEAEIFTLSMLLEALNPSDTNMH